MHATALARPILGADYPWLAAATRIALQCRETGHLIDQDFAVPRVEIAALHQAGLLLAPFPEAVGGAGLATGQGAASILAPVLRRIGSGSLPLGRLYEGHINAVGLVVRYGRPEQAARLAAEVKTGTLLGVWNTDDAEGLRLVEHGGAWRLGGRKVLCSGAGVITRPLVTARDPAGRLLMVIPALEPGTRADLSSWTAQGMRASATGTVDFDDLTVTANDVIGTDADYHRQPTFSGGAWRFAAVHQGGMETLIDGLREHLRQTGRGGDPHQGARLGQAAMAVETARLWVERAAMMAETADMEADAVVSYVNLARLAVERAGLDLLELVQRSIGLRAFMRPNPVERVARDLATYLRQPAPDRALTTAAAFVLDAPRSTADLWGAA